MCRRSFQCVFSGLLENQEREEIAYIMLRHVARVRYKSLPRRD